MASLFIRGKSDTGPAGERRRLFNSLIKLFPYIFVIPLSLSFLTYLWLSQFEPQYRAEATIFVDTGATDRLASVGIDRSATGREIVAAQAQLLRSRDLARPVMQRLGLSNRPEFGGGESRLSRFLVTIGLQRNPSLSSPDERALEAFSQALTVNLDEQSSVVTVAFTSPDPRLAAAVPNALAEEYVALTRAPRRAVNGADAATAAARIVAKSVVPAAPSFPQAGPAAAIVGLLTLVVLVGSVLFREIANGRRARREALLVLPEVADLTVPVQRNDNGGGGPVMADTPPSLTPEFDGRGGSSLAAVAEAIVADGFNRIMIATVADANGDVASPPGITLARAIASADRRTVLIDLRAAAADSAGESAQLPGFSDLFAGEASFGEVIFRDGKSRVHFIPVGLRPGALHTLAADRVGPLISALDHTYDHVIVDVAEDLVGTIAPLCDVVVVASRFAMSDTVAGVIGDLRAKTDAKIVLLSANTSAVAAPAADVSEMVDGEAA